MKKNVIAVIMSLIMAAGSVGGTQAFAAETTTAEAMEIAQDEEIVEPETIDEKFRKEYTDTGLQLLPHRDGVEGFFIARMRRIK